MTINSLAFNQGYLCISVSTLEYHKIFNCDPFGEFYSSQTQMNKSLATDNVPPTPTADMKMLFSTSLTIIVPQSDSNLGNRLLKIYNLKQRSKICELTFPSSIVDIKLNRKRLVVFLEVGQIYIYDLSCVRLIKVLEINSYLHRDDEDSRYEFAGDLSADDASYLALPLSLVNEQTDLFNHHDPQGEIRPSDSAVVNSLSEFIEFTHKNRNSPLTKKDVITLDDLKKESKGWVLLFDTVNLVPRLIYKAHDSSIAKISISADSTKIATASTKGTIVRVCHFINDEKMRITQITNLRRGHNLARINVMSFNLENSILGCGSESNTVHFFRLKGDLAEDSENSSIPSDHELNEYEHEADSSEDLNENLANLLISKRPSNSSIKSSSEHQEPAPPQEEKEGIFSMKTFRKTSKLLNNSYTKSIIKKLPYKDYFDNLIWEPPKRSFAFIKLPEYAPPLDTRKRKVEIGFTSHDMIMLASYQTGTFYHYQLPKKQDYSDREECYMVNQYSLLS